MSSRTRPDHPVVLPSSSAWDVDARLVGDVLTTVGSAAACTSDDTARYLQPTVCPTSGVKARRLEAGQFNDALGSAFRIAIEHVVQAVFEAR
ncbi:hypothetical protein GCM10010327_59080 [Streptomyces nitrosporeus]|nr:hypothetical protein GCM10010327_59080 [Streptomyces nitrosporeus]